MITITLPDGVGHLGRHGHGTGATGVIAKEHERRLRGLTVAIRRGLRCVGRLP
jgi:hypothetical protein